ncbi:Canalicular multispecific organic anion transporter 1 [Coemansia sp. RSA 520]|nr:Canalicular multispecific organic anion transporter 1 [Coemansia sp. RSA 520]KAJ2431829.1 Canalicular multispecific organic anion transporter 1 [Coemansia sp. RSA 2522]
MQSTVEHYRVIERFFKGDFVKTLSQLKEQPCHVPAVFMEKCSFRWSSRAEQSVIANASICVSAGELVAVNGATGSGKSALLLSISGELEMTNGAGHIAGKVGYLEQSPWIINDTLKANIIFGRDYNPMLYKQVIHACAFAEDLQMWPEGDLTIIGDRGINISGGQRARLALARTLYSQADIYVLDDPLSAVDAHVRRHIMENVILDTGMLAGKTRIIASNTDHIAPFANQSIIVDDGNVLSKRQVPAKYRKIQSTPPQISRHDAVYATDTHKPTTDSSSEPTPKQPAHSSVWDNVRYITDLCTLPLIIVTMVIGLVQPVASHIMDGYVLSALKPNSQLSSTDTNALLKYILLNMASQTIVGMLAKVSYCAESIIQQKYVAGKISQAFMRGVVHAPLSFFDNTSRHHLNSAYQEGVVSLASDTGRLLRSEVSVIARTCLTVFRISKNVPMLLLIAPVAAYLSAKHERHY